MPATKRNARNVHRDLQPIAQSPGGLFDVEPSELDLNVGRRCKLLVQKDSGKVHVGHKYLQYFDYGGTSWVNVRTGERGSFTIKEQGDEIYTITCVQRIYNGQLAYRVVGDHEVHKFGMPAKTHEVEFID